MRNSKSPPKCVHVTIFRQPTCTFCFPSQIFHWWSVQRIYLKTSGGFLLRQAYLPLDPVLVWPLPPIYTITSLIWLLHLQATSPLHVCHVLAWFLFGSPATNFFFEKNYHKSQCMERGVAIIGVQMVRPMMTVTMTNFDGTMLGILGIIFANFCLVKPSKFVTVTLIWAAS